MKTFFKAYRKVQQFSQVPRKHTYMHTTTTRTHGLIIEESCGYL